MTLWWVTVWSEVTSAICPPLSHRVVGGKQCSSEIQDTISVSSPKLPLEMMPKRGPDVLQNHLAEQDRGPLAQRWLETQKPESRREIDKVNMMQDPD